MAQRNCPFPPTSCCPWLATQRDVLSPWEGSERWVSQMETCDFRWVFLLCSPSLCPYHKKWRSVILPGSLTSVDYSIWIGTSNASFSGVSTLSSRPAVADFPLPFVPHWSGHSSSCSVWEELSSVLTLGDAPFSFMMKSSIHSLVEKWQMLKKWYSSGKAYYQTSDNEAGYQKLTQPTLGVFGFDHGCSTHAKIQGDLCKLGYSFSFARLSWESLELVLNICKYEYFIEL